jgi:hypothetical protein
VNQVSLVSEGRRVKIGPLKVSKIFWARMQQLPGDTDEERVLLAVEFVMRLSEKEEPKSPLLRRMRDKFVAWRESRNQPKE